MNNNNDDNNVADLQSDFKCFDSLLMQDQEHMLQIRYSCCVCICTAFVVVFYTCFCIFHKICYCLTLQCFDAVGWAAGRASGL